MEIQIEAVSPVKHRIRMSADVARVQKERDRLFADVRKQVQIRGFRPGKAPRTIIERQYGEHINEEIRSDLLEEGLRKAIEEHGLKIVARPEIESSLFGEDGGFEAAATVEIVPQVEPKDYFGLSVKRRRVAVTDAEVAERLAQLARMHAVMKPIDEDRPAKKGDWAELDLSGTMDGKALYEKPLEDYLLELGSGHFIVPGFEDGIEGMRPGEEKELRLAFPAEFPDKARAGREGVFQVKLKGLKQRVVPALDDEFAKDLGPQYGTLDALRQEQRELLERGKKHAARDHDRAELVEALLASHTFDVPEAMVAKQTQFMAERMRWNLQYSGISRREVDMMMENAEERQRPDAAKEVRASLLFDAIGNKEGVECAQTDLEAYFEDRARIQHRTAIEVSAEYQRDKRIDDLKASLREDKVIDLLLERAQTEWIDAPAENESEDE